MDEADIAQAAQERFDRQSLELHLAAVPKGESATECEGCGEPIPAERRRAAAGCIRCISCQEQFERRLR